MTPIDTPPDRSGDAGDPLVPREWWPDLAIGLVAFAAIALLPLLLGGYVHERAFVQYALLWRELVGEAGRLPLETPKPFTTLRAALGMGPFHGLAGLLFALAPVCLGRLSLRLYGTRVVGVGAVLLFLLGNSYFLPGPLLDGSWVLPYVGMMSVALWSFAECRYGLALSAVALSGLIRPDAWGYALFFLALVVLFDRDAWRPVFLAALLCVPAWILYDVALAGRPFYSSATLQAYAEVMGVPPVTFGTYWQRIVPDVLASWPWALLAAGIVGLGVALWRSSETDRWRGHGAAAGCIGLALLGYWGLSAVGEGFLFHVRFFVLPLLLLGFYALALPVEAVRWWGERGERRGVRTARVREVAAAALAATLALGWSRADPWAKTVERHRIGLLQREARTDALDWLRANWVGTDESLLTGRSLEVFAYRLGPGAARRMHHFRFLAEDPERLLELPDGVAVYIGHDIGGAHNWFVNLRKGETAEVRRGDFVLRFEPVTDLRHEDEVLGLIYRYRRVPPDGSS